MSMIDNEDGRVAEATGPAGFAPSRDASRPDGASPSREPLGAYVGLTSASNRKYPDAGDIADESFTFLPINKAINFADLQPRDAELVEHAVRIARPRYRSSAPRWVAVMDVFALGRTAAISLCERFGLDPEEKVTRR